MDTVSPDRAKLLMGYWIVLQGLVALPQPVPSVPVVATYHVLAARPAVSDAQQKTTANKNGRVMREGDFMGTPCAYSIRSIEILRKSHQIESTGTNSMPYRPKN